MEDKFSVKIIGIVFAPDKKQILVGKNKGDSNYTFVEGLLKKEEELDKCLKNATKEKTGYKIHNLGAIYAKNLIDKEKELLEIYFLCEATEGEEKAGDKVEELKWIDPCKTEEIMEVKFPTRLKEYIFGLGDNCSIE
ncbi:MAG: NUDIX hydrolase [Nanoarchaeota archaeon]|nr:NUDIX hydrolase [Nanoarchaeota archaeon]